MVHYSGTTNASSELTVVRNSIRFEEIHTGLILVGWNLESGTCARRCQRRIRYFVRRELPQILLRSVGDAHLKCLTIGDCQRRSTVLSSDPCLVAPHVPSERVENLEASDHIVIDHGHQARFLRLDHRWLPYLGLSVRNTMMGYLTHPVFKQTIDEILHCELTKSSHRQAALIYRRFAQRGG